MKKGEFEMNVIRCFISADIPEDVKRYLASIQAELPRLSGVNFVPKENLHVTLAFLGEISEKVLKSVIVVAEDVAERTGSFECSLGSLEAVPRNTPRLAWVTVNENSRLKEIHAALRRTLGFCDREFNGHITLARIKDAGAARAISKKIPDIKIPAMNFQIDRISIMESKLSSAGAVYSAIKTMNLHHE